MENVLIGVFNQHYWTVHGFSFSTFIANDFLRHNSVSTLSFQFLFISAWLIKVYFGGT